MVDGQQETTVVEDSVEESPETTRTDLEQGPDSAQGESSGTVAADVTGEDVAAGDQDANSDADSDADSEDDAEDDGEDDGEDDESDNPLDTEGEIAADYLEELLDIADLDGDIDTFVENGRAHVSVLTDSDVLVGKDGEVLEALQELTRLAVITETGNRSRLMLDIGGYRDRRRKALTELATDAVQDAKDSGEAVRLAPMNPFERKIVHDVVAGAGLTSESEGEEPQRRVVILPGA